MKIFTSIFTLTLVVFGVAVCSHARAADNWYRHQEIVCVGNLKKVDEGYYKLDGVYQTDGKSLVLGACFFNDYSKGIKKVWDNCSIGWDCYIVAEFFRKGIDDGDIHIDVLKRIGTEIHLDLR